MKIYCNEIVVKFRTPSRNSQVITYRDAGTAAKILMVHDDGIRLLIGFLNALEGDYVKVIGIPYTEIAEYDCVEVLAPARPAPTKAPGQGA